MRKRCIGFFIFSFKYNQNDVVLIIVTLKMKKTKKKEAVMEVRTLDGTFKNMHGTRVNH